MEALRSSETLTVTLPVALGYTLKDFSLQPTTAYSYFDLFVYNTIFIVGEHQNFGELFRLHLQDPTHWTTMLSQTLLKLKSSTVIRCSHKHTFKNAVSKCFSSQRYYLCG
jgi:hypothetical protein